MTFDFIKFKSLPIAVNPPLQITSGFSAYRITGLHTGVDIRATQGTTVLAVADGIVLSVISPGLLNPCGQGIVIKHTSTTTNTFFETTYCHMVENSPTEFRITEGSSVVGGQIIGRVGNTGRSTAPHLHFKLTVNTPELRQRPIDPTPYFDEISEITPPTVRISPSISPVSSLSPYITSQQSFHPNIQYELTRRRFASETANTHIPFVRLTSLMNVSASNLSGTKDAWCPSLGVHGEPEISFDDIYLPRSKKSIVGYATSTNGRVPVVVETSNFDQENIPVPGIIDISMERSLAGPLGVRGGLLKANLKIVAYSIGQVDALMRYFLRPSTRVVLEYGRKSSSATEKQNLTVFDWTQPASNIANKFKELITEPEKQREFINEYVYDNDGNYEIEIGYVVSFEIKYTKSNTFEISLTIHSVQQFEIANTQTGVKSTCPENSTVPCRAMDVKQYFDPSYAWMENTLSKLMGKVLDQTNTSRLSSWYGEVIPITSNTSRNSTGTTQSEGTGVSSIAGTDKRGYFVSWKFFVDVILNDREYGLLSTFNFQEQDKNTVESLLKTGLLRSTTPPTAEVNDIYKDSNKLVANRVGYHPRLRSTNPGVMLIYNQPAQDEADRKLTLEQIQTVARNKNITLSNSDIYETIKSNVTVGSFLNLANTTQQAGYSSLFNGVWINTNAILEAFTTTDTISIALTKLLTDMNTATEGYWNLQLISNDRGNPGMHVIDMALSPKNKNDDPKYIPDTEGDLTNPQTLTRRRYNNSTTNEPNYIYLFNRKTKQLTNDDIGSELLDLNIEFKLPLMVAVQAIAGVGGSSETSTLTLGGTKEINDLSLLKNLYTTCPPTTDTTDVCADSPYAKEVDNLQKLEQDRELLSGTILREGTDLSIANRQAELERDITNSRAKIIELENEQIVSIIRNFADLGSGIRMTEFNRSEMLKKLTEDSVDTNVTAHAFNSSNLTKLLVDLTIPGIGGIELWQSFLVDRVPNIASKGYFIVTRVTHIFNKDSGWLTKLQGMFRYKST